MQAYVKVEIFDILGRKITELENSLKEPGTYSLEWNGITDSDKNTSAGFYIYQIHAGEFVQTKKIVLLK